MEQFDISDTIQAKSDQLNADDLISAPRTITITAVTKGTPDNPVIIRYEGDSGRPFKPCKTVRRILSLGWGVMANEWAGKSVTLYNDPSVIYAGKAIGGIRIKAMSDIPKRIVVSLSTTRGKKSEHKIDVLEVTEKAMYDPAKFDKVLPAMAKQIEAGKMTHEQIINKCEETGALTEEQKTQVRNIGKAAGIDAEINEDDDFFGDNK